MVLPICEPVKSFQEKWRKAALESYFKGKKPLLAAAVDHSRLTFAAHTLWHGQAWPMHSRETEFCHSKYVAENRFLTSWKKKKTNKTTYSYHHLDLTNISILVIHGTSPYQRAEVDKASYFKCYVVPHAQAHGHRRHFSHWSQHYLPRIFFYNGLYAAYFCSSGQINCVLLPS